MLLMCTVYNIHIKLEIVIGIHTIVLKVDYMYSSKIYTLVVLYTVVVLSLSANML